MSPKPSLTFSPTTTLKLENNGAYVLNVKLIFNFIYLMSDGSTGDIRETTYAGGTKTPIAVVLSRSQHLAMALKNANNGMPVQWSSFGGKPMTNTHIHPSNQPLQAPITSGKDETWDASYSTATNGVKATNPNFPAFKVAAEYDPGVAYTGSPALQWYLPSASDWLWCFSALGFGNRSAAMQIFYHYPCWGDLAQVAFLQVGGESVYTTNWLWTSSQLSNGEAVMMSMYSTGVRYGSSNQYVTRLVRSFVKY